MIEERTGTSTNAERQFVWGLRYIDDLILRDRDTTGSGTLNERLYGLQDPNWNMVAVVNSSGVVQERFSFDAYGTVTFLTPAFAIRTASLYAWETLYAGYRRDNEVLMYQGRNRVLDPLLGWLQRDPLGLAGGTSLYEYVRSAPMLFVDPDGRLGILAWGCIVGALGGLATALIDDFKSGNWGACRAGLGAIIAAVFGCIGGVILAGLVSAGALVFDALVAIGLAWLAHLLWRGWGVIVRRAVGMIAGGICSFVVPNFANEIAGEICAALREAAVGVARTILDPIDDVAYRRCMRYCCASQDCDTDPNRTSACVQQCRSGGI